MKVEKIKYPMGALTAEGALIYDDKISGKRPAVLMAPNWMGMTEQAIERGKLMAGDRYVVFVADMYGAGDSSGRFRRGRGARQSTARERGRAAQAHPRRL